MQRTQRTTAPAPRGRSNLTATRKVPVPTNRNVSLSKSKPVAKKITPVVKQEEPKEDTRTAEEIDASYKRNVARFNAAKQAFDGAYARKVAELKTHFGVKDAKEVP